MIKGKIISVPLSIGMIKSGVMVCTVYKQKPDQPFDNIEMGRLEIISTSKEYKMVPKIGNPYSVKLDDLQQLVVTDGSKHYPLKQSQWWSSSKNGEVNSDKEVLFEVVNNESRKIAKVLPPIKNDVEQAWEVWWKLNKNDSKSATKAGFIGAWNMKNKK